MNKAEKNKLLSCTFELTVRTWQGAQAGELPVLAPFARRALALHVLTGVMNTPHIKYRIILLGLI